MSYIHSYKFCYCKSLQQCINIIYSNQCNYRINFFLDEGNGSWNQQYSR